jgi:RNA polymerase sigma-70 factor, ECF subfamily
MGDTVHSQGPIQAGVRVGELFEEHGRMVYAVCRLVLRDRVEAEDAAQQTFLSAYRSLLRGRGPEQPDAWLATIARNECRRRIEGRAPTAVPISDGDGRPADDPSTIVDRREEIEALCSAIAELPRAQRDAIVLREFYGLSYTEVAAALGLSGPAVESALFKSRRRLQDRLRSLRSAANLAAVPITLHESLARLVPGFAQAGGGATASKLALPVTVKAAGIVAAALAVGGTVTVATTEHHRVPPLAAPAEAATPRAPAPPARPEASAHQFTPVTQPAKRVVAHAFVHPLATTSSESEHQDGGQAESGDGHDGEPSDATRSDDHAADVHTIAPAPSSSGTTPEPTRTDDRGDDGGDLTAPSSDDGATPSGGDG